MGDDQEACIAGLHLGLGIGEVEPKKKKESNKHVGKCSSLSFSLLIKEEEETAINAKLNSNCSSFNGSSEENDDYRHQKKLRLTKEQSSFLETTFKFHNTLIPSQKQALSKQLNLKPRQVEVWFQNRRARTKLKQTETDCALLKKWCESLRDENQRLKMELQDLRCRKFGSSAASFCTKDSKLAHVSFLQE